MGVFCTVETRQLGVETHHFDQSKQRFAVSSGCDRGFDAQLRERFEVRRVLSTHAVNHLGSELKRRRFEAEGSPRGPAQDYADSQSRTRVLENRSAQQVFTVVGGLENTYKIQSQCARRGLRHPRECCRCGDL